MSGSRVSSPGHRVIMTLLRFYEWSWCDDSLCVGVNSCRRPEAEDCVKAADVGKLVVFYTRSCICHYVTQVTVKVELFSSAWGGIYLYPLKKQATLHIAAHALLPRMDYKTMTLSTPLLHTGRARHLGQKTHKVTTKWHKMTVSFVVTLCLPVVLYLLVVFLSL